MWIITGSQESEGEAESVAIKKRVLCWLQNCQCRVKRSESMHHLLRQFHEKLNKSKESHRFVLAHVRHQFLKEHTDIHLFFFLRAQSDTHHVWHTPASLQLSRELWQIVGKGRLVLQLLAINTRCPHLLYPGLPVLLAKWSS